MADWHTIEVSELDRLQEAIVSVVEHRSEYGKQAPDWVMVMDEIEASEDHLDLGSDLDSPVNKDVMARARKVYRELKAEL